MIPVARREKLLVSEVGQETIIYDEERDTAHCLNPVAANVWRYCDGTNTVKDIAQVLEEELNPSAEEVDWRGLVYLTLEELESLHLIEGYLEQPTGTPSISRRQMIKTASVVGGFAIGSMFPLVRSIVAPTPAMAAPDGNNPPDPEPSMPPCPSGDSGDVDFKGNSVINVVQQMNIFAAQKKQECTNNCKPCNGNFAQTRTTPKKKQVNLGTIYISTFMYNCTCSK